MRHPYFYYLLFITKSCIRLPIITTFSFGDLVITRSVLGLSNTFSLDTHGLGCLSSHLTPGLFFRYAPIAGGDISNRCMGTDNSKMRWDIWSNPSVCNYNNFNANPIMAQLLQKDTCVHLQTGRTWK